MMLEHVPAVDAVTQMPVGVTSIYFMFGASREVCILAEGAIALPVTLSGGALFAS